MGRDIVYLPGYYIEGEIEQSGYPFILDVFGEIHPLIPDTIHTHPLRLERKYPISNRLIDHSNKLLAGCIQASADSTFTDPVTFHIIARNTQGAPDTATIDSSRQPFRYWRYLSPNGSFCQIAELQFFKPDSLSPLPGRAIGTPGTLNNAFDGDPLTFYEYHEADGGWIGLDFGKPTRIDRIAFQPRNDDNYVVAGDEYELFYRSSTAWESLGKQKPSPLGRIPRSPLQRLTTTEKPQPWPGRANLHLGKTKTKMVVGIAYLIEIQYLYKHQTTFFYHHDEKYTYSCSRFSIALLQPDLLRPGNRTRQTRSISPAAWR